MEKQQAIEILARHFKIEPIPAHVARELKITPATVYQWPNPLTRPILSNICGRLVGSRIPREFVDALKESK